MGRSAVKQTGFHRVLYSWTQGISGYLNETLPGTDTCNPGLSLQWFIQDQSN